MSSQLRTLVATRKRKDRKPSDGAEPAKRSDNRLLAGLLAHEFLTHGTLLGRRWDPARSAPPVPDRKENKDVGPPQPMYVEASHLVMRGGAHVAGVFNPTQLGRWLQM